MSDKHLLVELVQSRKRPLWLRPENILYFEKRRTPTHEEIVLYLTNGKVFHVLDNDDNRKKIQLQFELI